MSDSDLAKQGLTNFFNEHAKLDSKVKDWKRTRKIKDGRGGYVREFVNAKAGITALVDSDSLDEYEGEDDYLYCHESGDLYVAIYHNPNADPDNDFDQTFSLMFVSRTQHERDGYFPDQHWGHVLEVAYDWPEGMLEDEVMENTFVPSQKWQNGTKEELIAALNAVPGVTYNPKLDNNMGLG